MTERRNLFWLFAVVYVAVLFGVYMTGVNDGRHFGFQEGVDAAIAELDKQVAEQRQSR